jgi:release factor glutamine methyltransferase
VSVRSPDVPAVSVGGLLADAMPALATASATPQLDAELLLATTLGVRRSTVLAFPERAVGGEESEQFARLVARRARGEPLAYINGRKEF